MTKTALITGIFGQDGSYLTELLHEKGYTIHGIVRRPLSNNAARMADYLSRKQIPITLHEANLAIFPEVANLIKELRPHECYHLSATHFSSSTSAEDRKRIASLLYDSNVLSASHLIHALMRHSPETHLILAGSCLMFEKTTDTTQTEETPFLSSSTYGLSKIAATELASAYRDQRGLHLSTAILYNHESPRRDISFVTQKISRQVVRIKNGSEGYLVLGNLDSQKDWGYARDYVRGMWVRGKEGRGRDYILASGQAHSVEEFARLAFDAVGLPNWRDYVRIEEALASTTAKTLVGNPAKAQRQLGWRPTLSFEGLVALMVRCAVQGELD